MVETIVLIAIPAIGLVVTSVVVIWDELKMQKLREAMFEECKRLLLYGGDENAKLREQVVRWQDEWESERDYADQMEAREKKAVDENAKLRELAKNLYECNGSCTRCVELMGKCEYEEQLREFGIEVEDA